MGYSVCRFASFLIVLTACCSDTLRAQVGESPLDVQVVLAFPKLSWPDSLTGADSGKHEEPRPLAITGAGDGTNRLFVATQPGTIHVFENKPDVADMKMFLDLRDRVHYRVPQENEEGFLGLAFHPNYKENGEFFVYYTNKYKGDADRKSIISRFRVKKDNPDEADPASEEVILEIAQPYWNHNGGTLAFGADGMLYIALGDGGFRDDPHNNGQNLHALLGKVLRIDVDHKDKDLAYAIPQDNPFVSPDPRYARGEIWAYGLRNIWRMAFDRANGDLWAGDVGQDAWEEIDLIVRGGNYGWNLREGFHKFGPFGADPRPDLIEPILEYNHDAGKSITGGNVYRGERVTPLVGGYLYADYVAGQIWALWYDKGEKKVTANRLVRKGGAPVTTFGEDDAGETYFCTQEGGIWTFAPPVAK